MSYQKPPIIDEDETAALLVPTITPLLPTTTMDRRSSKTRLAIVAGMILMVAGGTVLLQDGGTTAEGLIVATQGLPPCVTATGTFGGVSTTTYFGEDNPFQTCYQYGDDKKYCWSNSYPATVSEVYGFTKWYECHPNPKHGQWDSVNPKYVNPVTHPYSCGPACTDMYNGSSF